MTRPASVRFERIGRCRDVPDLPLDLDDSDSVLVDALLRHCRRYLGSREFDVYADGTVGGVVLIDGGRFGRGRIVDGRKCPDDGKCHHDCGGAGPCWRVSHCEPLSAAGFPNNEWPADVRAAEAQRDG